jgi:hypothetical protein
VHNVWVAEIDGISQSRESYGGWIMDDRLRREVLEFVHGLAVRENERLAALGTFVEIEDLTAEIGDEVARQLARVELTRRAQAMTEAGRHACPECGKEALVEAEAEPLILQGLRGEVEYSEPICQCTRCRVSFFPSGRRVEAPSA